MNASETLDLFEKHARRWLNVMPLNTCIEQTRVLIECLKAFGVKARPVGAKLSVICPAREYQFVSGIDPWEVAHAREVSKSFTDKTEGQGGSHVVAIVEDAILVDLTVAQASSKENGFVLDPCMISLEIDRDLSEVFTAFFPPDGGEAELTACRIIAEARGSDDTEFRIEWILTPAQDWLKTPAWEPSHLWRMIHRIIYEMRREVQSRSNRASSRSR